MYRFFSILIASLLIGGNVIRNSWLQKFEIKNEVVTRNAANEIGNQLAHDTPVDENTYRGLINSEPKIGYIVVMDYRTGYKSGAINSTILERGGEQVLQFLKDHGDEATISYLIQKNQGFPNENLNVISAALNPSVANEKNPFGTVKIGYIVPGYPYGRGYFNLWMAISGILVCSMVYSLRAAAKASAKFPRHTVRRIDEVLNPVVVDPKGDLDSLNFDEKEEDQDLQELDEALDSSDVTIVDDLGREWKPIFDGKSLEGWQAHGDWYITEREIAGQPWGSSLVHQEFGKQENYHFQLRAKKVAGPDAYLVLFPCGEHHLIWVIGGWENSRSELIGYEKTQAPIKIEKFTWYKIEIRVESENVEGFINDQVVWSLPRTSITMSSTDLGFQKGLGIAVWNTFSKFKDIRFLAL